MAVSELFNVNIVTIQENHEPYFAAEYKPQYNKTIFLAYREGINNTYNHYDAICNIHYESVYKIARYLCQKMNA